MAIPPVEIAPPKIIAGPFVKYITDVSAVIEWETDKEANSRVVYDGNNSVVIDELTKLHSVLLVGLTPNTSYLSWVSSIDKNQLLSETLPANFITHATPDSSLPRFLIGPSVYSMDSIAFTVSFCADEAVTGVITIDST